MLAVALLFLLIRSWLGMRDSITLPLLGSLLVGVSPAAACVVSQAQGGSVLWSVDFFLLGALLYLAGTRNADRHLYGRLALCCWCVGAAAAAYPVMLIGPLAVVIMDWLRVRETHFPRTFSAWISPLMVLGCGLAVFLVIGMGAEDGAPDAAGVSYLATVAGALVACRVVERMHAVVLRRGLVALLALLVPVGAVISFWLALACVDPIVHLENQIARMTKMRFGTPGHAVLRKYFVKTRLRSAALAMQAGRLNAARATHLFGGETILRARSWWMPAGPVKRPGGVLTLQKRLLTPIRAAARLRASVLEVGREKETVDLFAFAAENNEPLSGEERLRYARALAGLGDIETARETLATMPELPQDSPEGGFQRSVVDASNGGRTLQESYRKKISQNPKDLSAYVDLAKGCLLSGNNLRAFYFLEMVLRREPANREAWEYLGMVFARVKQPACFISQWGAAVPERSRPGRPGGPRREGWVWDAALITLRPLLTGVLPPRNTAVFALNQTRTWRQWVSRCGGTPELTAPACYKSISPAGNAPDKALAFLRRRAGCSPGGGIAQMNGAAARW